MDNARRGPGELAWGPALASAPAVQGSRPQGPRVAQKTSPRVRVLCVDDEPMVLEGLALHLRRQYEVVTATSGAQGLQLLDSEGPFAVVLSDMRMPGMDGAAFLSAVRQKAPDSVRMILTGQTDLYSAIAVVNEAQLFRFLTKPCPPEQLLAAFQSAAQQHSLITAEKVLLEQTLSGSVKVLVDVLSLANPSAFGRATRIRHYVSEVCSELQLQECWQLELAAMLSHLGWITLPEEVADKAYFGQPLSEAEQALIGRLPAVAEQLLAHIPRLETIRKILLNQAHPPRREAAQRSGGDEFTVMLGAQLLRIATDYDLLEAQGNAPDVALDTLRGRAELYDAQLLEVFAQQRGNAHKNLEIREVPLSAVRVGMVFAEDVHMATGALLAARGYEVTASLVARLHAFRPGAVREPVRVILALESRGQASLPKAPLRRGSAQRGAGA